MALRFSFLAGVVVVLVFAEANAFADAPKLATPYQTEQKWIVSSVCRNAFELLAFAKDKKGDAVTPAQVELKAIPGETLSYDVTVHGAHAVAEAKLQWPGSLWAPAAYVPFCQAAAKALGVAASPAAAAKAEGNPLHTLLDYSETAIEAENHRVSLELATQPDNAAAHEQAALILGTLAMKENSGDFWDPRDMCNHVCTHLAVAQFLRGGAPMSVEGRLADILVGLIVDTKTQTGHDLDALAAEKDAPPDLAAWINAGRMRNTRDWRALKMPETASWLEQVEYIRALAEAVDPDQALAWLQAHSVPNRADWNRIILEMGYSVDAGHALAEHCIAMEVKTMQATFPGSFVRNSLVADLNEPPGDAVVFDAAAQGKPAVISRGMWAQFFQRHLCHAISETGNFFAKKWGVPENARALDAAVQKDFSTLTFYPYLQLVEYQSRGLPAEADPAATLFAAHPELAPDNLMWMRLPPGSDGLKQMAKAWFTPPVVQGTAYGAMSRTPEGGWDKAEVDKLYAIAPLQLRVAQWELKALYGTNFTLAQFQKVMGPLADYYVPVMNQAKDAAGLTFDERVQLAEKATSISPDGYNDLAQLYLDNHQEDKAAQAYQNWFDKASDRVWVSNSMDWLVNYYFDHGDKDKALHIAKDCAEVYSATGLQTMMKLQARMGQLDQAEDYGKKINERYQDSGPLMAFYHDQAAKGNVALKAKFDAAVQAVFPNGMKSVTLASFSAAPDEGVKFTRTTPVMARTGLSSDQVMVALDGYQVENQNQYMMVRNFSDAPAMTFIVWDGSAYKEIKANQPGRRFGVDLSDYKR